MPSSPRLRPEVVLTFGETVQAPPTAIEVFSAAGQQVRTGPVEHPSGRGNQVRCSPAAVDEGTYVVSWRVISADTHPVQGAFTFSVGAPSAGAGVGALEQHLLASRHPSRALGSADGSAPHPDPAGRHRGRGRRRPAGRLALGSPDRRGPATVRAGGDRTGGRLASAAAVLVQGPYDAGRPLGDALRLQCPVARSCTPVSGPEQPCACGQL